MSKASDQACCDGAHDALNRMGRAFKRGTGCYLTAEQIQSLSLTTIGELWEQEDPRTPAPTCEKE